MTRRTPAETVEQHAARVIAEVTGDLDWAYRQEYAAFIGPRCPGCGRRGCEAEVCGVEVLADFEPPFSEPEQTS